MDVTFHFDPTCPWTWVTSRWLLRAADETPGLDVRWAPFSLAHLQDGRETPEKAEPRMRASRAATRVVQHLLDAGDQDGVGRFYDVWGDRYHHGRHEPSVDLVVDAARTALGLDDATAREIVADESLDRLVDEATDEAFAAAGPDIGSPVLRWVDERGEDVAIFGPLLDSVPDPACAAEVWLGVRHLAVHGFFKELKRGRHGPPDPAAS